MSQAIALTVLGGFLGAGKTTVLNHLLQAPHGLRLMVLVNDFGAVNIDASLIQSVSGDGVISLRNGCVCCSMGGELMNALMAIEKQADHLDGLVIEGSGVSDPRKIAQIGMLGDGFSLQSIITVVDAVSVLDQRDDPYVGDMVETQVAGAHLILLNKTDLADPAHCEQVLAWLHQRVPGVPVFTGRHGRFDWELLLGPSATIRQTTLLPASPVGAGARLFATGASARGPAAVPQSVFQSYCFDSVVAFDQRRLQDLFEQLPEAVLRAKGPVRVGPQAAVHVLHYVRGQPMVLESWPYTATSSSLVFVGTSALDQDALAVALEGALLD
ncbi:MAG: CobW family GTP-binding protein [Advenella sp.]